MTLIQVIPLHVGLAVDILGCIQTGCRGCVIPLHVGLAVSRRVAGLYYPRAIPLHVGLAVDILGCIQTGYRGCDLWQDVGMLSISLQ